MANPPDGFIIKTEFNGGGDDKNEAETTAVSQFQPGLTSCPEGSKPVPADKFPLLRGQDHHSDFIRGCQELRDTGLLFDYTIMAGGQTFKAHHAVLAAHSGFIRRRASEGHSNELDLANLDPVVVHALLDFVYMGETTIDYGHLEDLLAIGVRLEIPGLKYDSLVDSADDNEDDEDNSDGAKKRKRFPSKTKRKRSTANADQDKNKKRKGVPMEAIQHFPKKKDGEEFVRSEKSGKYVCSYCHVTFASKNGVVHHVSLHTGEAKTHKCLTCEYQSTIKGNVKKHALRHHGMDGDVFDTLWKQREQEQSKGNGESTPGPSMSVKESEHSKKIKQEPNDEEGGKKR